MTEEQLKKRAEEYAKKIEKELLEDYEPIEYGTTPYLATIPTPHNKQAFIDGYHECEKEHEWHKVSEVGLPKESGRYFVYVGGGENGVYPLDFDTEANDFGYWCLEVASASLGVTGAIFETITERNEDKVIAWKEIVLPKEKE